LRQSMTSRAVVRSSRSRSTSLPSHVTSFRIMTPSETPLSSESSSHDSPGKLVQQELQLTTRKQDD